MPFSPVRRAPSTIVAAVLVATGLSACQAAADGQQEPLIAALCAAIEAPDAASAATIFERDVHQPLHEVADEVAAAERSIATSLLEAKFDVETVVRDDADAPDTVVRQRLETLTDRTRAALQALDRPAPSC